MNNRCRTSLRRSRRALTLVEVVAALAMVGVLLTTLLTAQARFTRQWQRAERRIEAVAAADRMVATWWAEPSAIPRRAGGEVAGGKAFAWRTTVVDDSAARQLGGEIVRLDIVDLHDREAAPVVVDVLLPFVPTSIAAQEEQP